MRMMLGTGLTIARKQLENRQNRQTKNIRVCHTVTVTQQHEQVENSIMNKDKTP